MEFIGSLFCEGDSNNSVSTYLHNSMSNFDLAILPVELIDQYKSNFNPVVRDQFEGLHDSDLSITTFNFYASVSAVFSSKIEGESIELDSYIKHKRLGVHYQSDHTRKIDDLYNAYLFAQQSVLTPTTLSEAHTLLTSHMLQPSHQGKFRKGNMYVLTSEGKIEYVAALPGHVPLEMDKWFTDLDLLLAADLSFEEVLFYAAALHLVFIKIHPYDDGNGRIARLLEKWFLAQKLGEKAWFIQSERYYYENHATYYENIRHLGLEYETLNYDAALPFLEMMPQSIGI